MADGARVGTATVLFTDLVGSTELRSRIGEDAAEALRGRHDALDLPESRTRLSAPRSAS